MASHQGQGQGHSHKRNNLPGHAPGNPNTGGAGNQPPANQSNQPNQSPSGGDGNNQVSVLNATNFGDLSYLPQGQPTRGRGGYRGRGGHGRGGSYTPEERRQFFSARNPFMVGPQFASPEIVDGNLGLVNKRTHNELTNSILVEPANATMPERWLGTFNHTEGSVSMANMFKHTHPAKTEFSQLIITKTPIEVAMDESKGLTVDTRGYAHLIPYASQLEEGGGKKRKIENNPIVCANCLQDTHVLGDCAWPYSGRWGDIFGCPVCNTKDHYFDNCPNQADMGDHEKFRLLVQRRAGKCLIRSDTPVFQWVLMAVKDGRISHDIVLPWSRESAKRVFHDETYINILRELTYADPRKPVTRDHLSNIANLEELVKTETGSFAQYKEYLKKQTDQANAEEQQNVAQQQNDAQPQNDAQEDATMQDAAPAPTAPVNQAPATQMQPPAQQQTVQRQTTQQQGVAHRNRPQERPSLHNVQP
ncbi:hypothetical protein F4821DRAFT_251415 [Hypoxylon rubiginosum]|uniref:Uncharacterized protein n=1 Tax=Hypoxylon rubiginosum TaxID=110542 RepID=A0ACC0CJA1_9PEZI|nr:hypothetical protein F4821DRAFT_251415 [Hypoxylon rubiginosum]